MNNLFSTNVASLHNYIRALRAPPFLTSLAQPSGAPPTLPTAQDPVSAPWGSWCLPQMLQQRLGAPQACVPIELPSAQGWDSLDFLVPPQQLCFAISHGKTPDFAGP